MNKSLTDFLRTAMEPVGSTMYIWGGGWNSEDNGAGEDAKIIGVNPNWKKFFISQDSDYDYKEHNYRGNYVQRFSHCQSISFIGNFSVQAGISTPLL